MLKPLQLVATCWDSLWLFRRTCACPWTKLRSRPSPMVALEMPTSNAARPGQGSDLGIQIPSEMDCSHGKRNLIGLPFSFIPQKMCVFLKRLSNKNAKQRFFVSSMSTNQQAQENPWCHGLPVTLTHPIYAIRMSFGAA